ncbi:acyclic terpene utilization AtuA family protein [Rhodospirillum sp. A1_3_36]|uniref:acyclic terpene utilization AtuA family protein n=1 Tax=Rhodospirillum sp. A1_3_36 TaxID=3391666 RepID=UPI0039A753AE
MRSLRLGAGAGFSGDRIDSAVELAENGALDYLVFECLAERTIAIAQQAKRTDPTSGYDPLLKARMEAILPVRANKGFRIVTNMGAANPQAAAEAVAEVARSLGLQGLRIATVTGDDVLAEILRDDQRGGHRVLETGALLTETSGTIISANAYLGAAPIVAALETGADVVITGRAADPALFLAPLIHEFGWAMDDWTRLGRGTLVGHLLECAGQITGGYFADPGHKDVPDMARLGMPIGIVSETGEVVITKTQGSGGRVTPATCKEQLLYEIHDPTRYLQPDVIADFSGVRVDTLGPDEVRLSGANGTPCTGQLKVSVGLVEGWVGEGQISYAGPGAVARGRLALEILRERMDLLAIPCSEVRGDLIGLDSVLGSPRPDREDPFEVRVRFAARTNSPEDARRVAREVDALYLNGPAGGGGVVHGVREVIGILSILIPEDRVHPHIHFLEA